MKDLETRFEQFRKANPYNGDYIIMCMTVRGMGWKRSFILKAFNKLVSDEEYSQDEKHELIDYLEVQTNLGDLE